MKAAIPESTDLVPVLVCALNAIAMKISIARDELYDCDDNNKATQIADALSVAGWVADKALDAAGSGLCHGTADDWFLNPALYSAFAELAQAKRTGDAS